MKLNISTIDEIAELIKTGKTPPTKNKKYFDGEIDWFTPGDLEKSFYLQESERTITKEAIRDNKAVVFPKGTVLISCIGNIGKVGVCFSEQSSSNQQITGILPTEDVASEYLYYWVKANKKILEHNSNNAVVPILNNAALKRIKIKYPSFENQKQIVKALDTADTLRQKRKEQLNLLDDYLKSVFFEIFGDPVGNKKGWEVFKLNEFICYLTSGGRGWSKYYSETGARFIRSFDVQMNSLSDNDTKYVNPPNNKEAERTRIKPMDILLTITGSRIGRVTVMPNNIEEAHVSQHVAIIRVKNINQLYLSYYLSMPEGGQRIIQRQQYGQTKPGLSLEQIKNFLILYPPIKLQNKFASIVEQVKQAKQKMCASLDEMDNHFNALMQRYFG